MVIMPEVPNLDSNSRVGVRLRGMLRRLLRLFGGCSERGLEYDFVFRNIVGKELSILDVGGVGSLLPLHLARKGHYVTVCDVKPYLEYHPRLETITGDFLTHPFHQGVFDVVVMVSTVEHIGMGYYGDPSCEDGDLKAVQRARDILKKKNGRLILTTPFVGQFRTRGAFERWYDTKRLASLLKAWQIIVQEYWIPAYWVVGYCVKWIPGNRKQAQESRIAHRYHGTVCLVAVKG